MIYIALRPNHVWWSSWASVGTAKRTLIYFTVVAGGSTASYSAEQVLTTMLVGVKR